MTEVIIEGYSINLDSAREVASLKDLKKDGRFFHQHTGQAREDLCKELWEVMKRPDDEIIEIQKASENPEGSTDNQ